MLQKLKRLRDMYIFNPETMSPTTIFIELTGACNSKCPNCPRTYSDKKRGHMSDALFNKVITQIADAYPELPSLGFHFFGEIELRKDFHLLISEARERLPHTKFGISTTLTSRSKEVVRNLLLAGFNGIGVWPDGYSEESYSLIRPGNSFQLVKENIALLLEERGKMGKTDIGVGVGMVRNSLNREHIQDFYREFEFVKKYPHTDLVTVDSHDWAGQVPSTTIIRSVKKYAFKIQRPCPMPFTNLIISADGGVSLCCMDMNMNLAAGSMDGDDDINKIWTSDRAALIRQGMKRLHPPELCRQCHNFYIDLSPSRIMYEIKLKMCRGKEKLSKRY
jgi:MoaA/NifB/PqqE/SkfB family radical SAM enzyme